MKSKRKLLFAPLKFGLLKLRVRGGKIGNIKNKVYRINKESNFAYAKMLWRNRYALSPQFKKYFSFNKEF
ncbi:TPA: hypothetical protein DCP15_02300 [Candidatus Uhrbacteria bacterium]|nr:hypothetical protein [Candidatus Uhrbacteria bacterium]